MTRASNGDDTRQRAGRLFHSLEALLLGAILVFGATPDASASGGLDTPQGVTSIPFSIEGSPVMNMTSAGLGIGIGTAEPTASLQVWGLPASGTNGYGLAVAAPTGAANNYAAVFAGGNVGIGITNPSAQLDITGTQTMGLRYVKTGSADARISVGDPTQTWSWSSGWTAGGDFSLVQEGISGDRLYFQHGGLNAGLNTASPIGTLDIENGSNNATLCLNGQCVTSLTGTSSLQLVTASQYGAWGVGATASCPSGQHLVLGGANCSNSDGVFYYIASSQPVVSSGVAVGWTAFCGNAWSQASCSCGNSTSPTCGARGGLCGGVTAYAYCSQ